MTQPDFVTLSPQFAAQWQDIEKADPSQRRVLVSELIRALADWEARRTDPLARLPALQRAAHWSAVADMAAAEAGRIAAGLGAEKAALHARLTDSAAAINAARADLAALTAEVGALDSELAVADTSVEALGARADDLRARLHTLQRLRELAAALARQRAEIAVLTAEHKDVTDPGGLLAALAQVHKILADFYAAWQQASADLAAALGTEVGDLPPPDADLLALPERLLALDRELGAIDQVLTARVCAQDAEDQARRAHL